VRTEMSALHKSAAKAGFKFVYIVGLKAHASTEKRDA
jgi:hypothetical protein